MHAGHFNPGVLHMNIQTTKNFNFRSTWSPVHSLHVSMGY